MILNENQLSLLSEILKSKTHQVLWPNTPIKNNHQRIIKKRVGAKDSRIKNKNSRSAKIHALLKILPSRSISILDLGIGDAVLGMTLKRKYPQLQWIGVDIFVDKFSTHIEARKTGIIFIEGFMQNIIDVDLDQKIDIFIMLNSFRNWESAQLSQKEKDFPIKLDNWIAKNCRIAILTLERQVLEHWMLKGKTMLILGKGEDDSIMVAWII